MKSSRLIAVDPSLTCSGWALFELQNRRLIGVGKLRSLGPEHNLSDRLADLQQKISKLFNQLDLSESDIMVCEGPTTMKDPRAALLIEQVRCIFETLARSASVKVPGRLNPRTVQHEVMGLRGSQLNREIVKRTAASTVWSVYREQLLQIGLVENEQDFHSGHQDIIDAVLVGSLAVERVHSAEKAKQALPIFFEEGRSPRPRRVPLS